MGGSGFRLSQIELLRFKSQILCNYQTNISNTLHHQCETVNGIFSLSWTESKVRPFAYAISRREIVWISLEVLGTFACHSFPLERACCHLYWKDSERVKGEKRGRRGGGLREKEGITQLWGWSQEIMMKMKEWSSVGSFHAVSIRIMSLFGLFLTHCTVIDD